MLRQTLYFLASNNQLRRTATSNRYARKLAVRFVAGETLEAAVAVVKATNAAEMTASLDHLGENVTSRGEATRGADSCIAALDAIASNGFEANISCKLTHLGLDLGADVSTPLIDRVVAAAAAHDNFVRIDMEGSLYTDTTIEVTEKLFATYGHVGTVIQSCLYRSADDVLRLNRQAIRIRLVKGAYLESPKIAYPQKRDVDSNYRHLSDLLLRWGTYPAFATHDEKLINWIKSRAEELGKSRDTFEFQMLYGIRRDLQRELHGDGYRVRLYIPYGTQWYPYLMRRLAERPANLTFMIGNVAREAGR